MNLRTCLLPTIASLTAAAMLLTTGDAAAQQYEPDGARFRGGAQLDVGGIIVPDQFNLGYIGASGQLGVQVNNLFGIYTIPQFDIVFGDAGGVHLGAAIVADFTFGDIVSVGAGPEVALFAAIGVDESTTGVSATGGALYGARIHGAVYPVVDKGDNGYSRKALAIGLDLRLLGGDVGRAEIGPDGESISTADFVFSPQLTIGYQAF